MPDAIFEHPRLVAVYDVLDGDRLDLDPYVLLAEKRSARSVLDVGCGTGVLAVLLAGRGIAVTGVDPAPASVEYARARPGGHLVTWLDGDATVLPSMAVDLVMMTGNVAQAIVDADGWAATLRGGRQALAPDGLKVFETRDPVRRAWEEWTRPATQRTVDVPRAGEITTWTELTAVDLPLVSFRTTWRFAADGAVLTSDSTLRFRGLDELAADLARAGLCIDEVGDAPDRPGREFVVHASAPSA